MKVIIKETGKEEILETRDENGIEWTNDLLGNAGISLYNDKTEQNEISQDDFEWWKNYINNYENDSEEIEELAEELGIEKSIIVDKITKELNCDMEDEHAIIQRILEEIREEYQV